MDPAAINAMSIGPSGGDTEDAAYAGQGDGHCMARELRLRP